MKYVLGLVAKWKIELSNKYELRIRSTNFVLVYGVKLVTVMDEMQKLSQLSGHEQFGKFEWAIRMNE